MSGPEPAAAQTRAAQRLVARNASLLVGAQVIAAPLSALVNVVAARALGPEDFGRLYLATTYAAFAMLFVEWGQGGSLTALVAREPARVGELLGSGLAWRAAALPVVALALAVLCLALGYDRAFFGVLAMVLLASACATVSACCQDAFRGLERADVSARTYVAWQALAAVIVVPTLLLGGRLPGYLVAQVACAAVGACVMLRLLAPLGVRGMRASATSARALASAGTTFLVFNMVLALQTNLDAVFMSKLASADAVGWNAAARKLTGLLIFPTVALNSALFPTLCRLNLVDPAAAAATARAALRVTLVAAVPVALGCALFPGLGIALFGQYSYHPAEDNLRVLALFMLFVYCTMPIGAILAASGRQRAWSIAQFACVLLSAVLDPLLIPWFQARAGNGGLGVCVATVLSEALMVGAGMLLLPRGVLDRTLGRTVALAGAGGIAMAAVALIAAPLGAVAAAVLALLGYAACLWATGEIDRDRLRFYKSALMTQRPS